MLHIFRARYRPGRAAPLTLPIWVLLLIACQQRIPTSTPLPQEWIVQTRVVATLTALAEGYRPSATPTQRASETPVIAPTMAPVKALEPSPTSTPSQKWTYPPTWPVSPTPLHPSATPTSSYSSATPPSIADWRGEYYVNRDLSGEPTLVRNDAAIDFFWRQESPSPLIPLDGFSVRWSRSLFFEGATYRFNVLVNEGARLWVDDLLLIDAWYDAETRTVTGLHALVRGTHSLTLEYYNRSGDAIVRLWWEQVEEFPDWKGEYWWNQDMRGSLALVRNDKEIAFDWGLEAPAPGLPADSFSVRWTRAAQFDAATYRFHVVADDGMRVWLNDLLLIDAWEGSGGRTITAVYPMVRGVHKIRVEYYENIGAAVARFWWEKEESFPDWKGEYWWVRDLSGSPALVRNDTSIDYDWGLSAPAPGLPEDNFSVRWTRTAFFEEGLYRFRVLADDAVRVWVDDVLLIDAWQARSLEERSAELPLSQGEHRLRVEYADYGGSARIRFWWERVETFPDWKGEYWPNRNLSGAPLLVRNDAKVDFDWGDGSPGPGLPADDFSARWTRVIFFEAASYRFHIVADDIVRFWVDDVLLLDAWYYRNPAEMTVDRFLTRGEHSLRLEYAEISGNARVRLWWEKVESFPDWKGEYWANRYLSGDPALVRNDAWLDFDWGTGAPAQGLPVDEFSARWTRTIQSEGRVYRFRVLADDLVRLWVNDVLLIDAWVSYNPSEMIVDYPLVRGEHRLRVEYAEITHNARIRVWWEKLDDYPDWRGEYWANREFSGSPALVRNDPRIDFNWGTGAAAPGLPEDGFAVRWTREIVFAEGSYRFHAYADDGFRLYMDGELILDEWHISGGDHEYTAERALAGRHQLVVEYYENTLGARVSFWWERLGDSAPRFVVTGLPQDEQGAHSFTDIVSKQ